jgi:hypothetical protein
MKKARRPLGIRMTKSGYIAPVTTHGPGDLTEYEVAAKTLAATDLARWVRKNYLRRWVPEEVLKEMGLKPEDAGRWWA